MIQVDEKRVMSRYEAMRKDPSHWKLGILYCCPDDPRVIVRQLLPVGWTWNFGHPLVFPAILLTVLFFLTPVTLLYLLGIRSKLIFLSIISITLTIVILMAIHQARDPDEEHR